MYSLSESIDGVLVRTLSKHEDERGWLCELYRSDEWDHQAAMCYASWTLPGKARGPHEHVYQSDCFAFLGPGMFRLYLWDARQESKTYLHRMRLDVGEEESVGIRAMLRSVQPCEPRPLDLPVLPQDASKLR